MLLKFFVCTETFHECNIFRSSRDYKVKMPGIIFLCEGKTVLVHIDSSVYIFPEVPIDVERFVQKSCSLPVGLKSLKNTSNGVQFLVKLHV